MNREYYEIVVEKANGRKEKRLMSDHIKYSRNTQPIRIHYLWDSEADEIVIGSLPDHLPTATAY